MSWQALEIQVELSSQALDDKVVQIRQECPQQVTLHCRQGCSGCCNLAVVCTFAEAAVLARRLTSHQQQRVIAVMAELEALCRQADNLKTFLRLHRDRDDPCLLLDDGGSCSLYGYRPLACRALLSTRPADWCAVDFATLHPLEKQAFLSSLDPALVSFPSHYLAAPQDEGAALQAAIGDTMIQHYGFSLTGNLQWLLGLELKYELSRALATDSCQIKEWLSDQQQRYPYLLEVGT